MESLIAKGNAVQPSIRKGSKKYSKTSSRRSQNATESEKEQHDPTLHSIEHRTALPRSLRVQPSTSASSHNNIRDKKLRAHLLKQSQHSLLSKELIDELEDPLFAENDAGQMVVEGEMDRTWRVSQEEIVKSVDGESARMRREVKLDGGPYRLRYTRNGRHLAIVGRKGHAATFDALTGNLHSELQLKETCRDITFLQDTSFHAVAQKKHAFIYDRDGVEIHRLSSLIEPTRLEFLPYHWILVSMSLNGHLHYLDTTTGSIVATHNSHLGACETMCKNPQNAVIHCGHRNGTVTLWTPNMSTPAVRLLAHLGPVTGLAVWGEDGQGGRHMATAGADGGVKIWDARTWKEPLRHWSIRASSSLSSSTELSFSQSGYLAVSTSGSVNVYTPPTLTTPHPHHRSPPLYLTHPLPAKTYAPLMQPRFAPFFDVLSVGHGTGWSSLLVPGCAEAKWDSHEADPYENIKMRREREVKGLLDKINPALITLNPEFAGTVAPVDKSHNKIDPSTTPFARLPRMERLKLSGKADVSDETGEGGGNVDAGDDEEGEAGGAVSKVEKEKNKMRGKNKSLKRYLRKKRKNIIDPATIAIRAKIDKQRQLIRDGQKAKAKASGEATGEGLKSSALDRFR